MPCYNPLHSIQYCDASGSIFRAFPSHLSEEFRRGGTPIVPGYQMLPCGQCIGCRLERARSWAMRCMHEAAMHKHSCFLTLTYNEDNVPFSLNLEHLQDFHKRLKYYRPDDKIRYYQCGEYGDNFGRPHYHVLLFGTWFSDRQRFKKAVNGEWIYVSKELEKIWDKGFCTIGEVNFESAGYCARYALKKVTGDRASSYYLRYNPKTGEDQLVMPEFATMSRRGGIGKSWWELYKKDRMNHDYVVVRGVKCKPPRYYDDLVKAESQGRFAAIKERRLGEASKRADDNIYSRLKVKEAVKESKLRLLKRQIEV